MMGTSDIPHRDSLKAYGHAVAGHAGTMTSPDGELFIKPCTQAELDFYHAAHSSREYEDFADLMPVFMGELRLSDPSSIDMSDVTAGAAGQAAMEKVKATLAANEVVKEETKATEPAKTEEAAQTPQSAPGWVPKSKSKKIKTDLAIVLENTASKFKHPNILDVKLGRRLWADDAPEEKKQRFDKISEITTHKNFGFRIAGMRVYRGSDNPSELGDDEYRTYDKDYGRTQVNDDNIHEAIGKFIFNEAAGVDKELGNAVLSAFIHEVEKVRDVLNRHESRMYSASLLFVFEGDGASLREAIEENNEVAERPIARDTTNKRVDSGIAMEDDEDDEDDEEVSLPSVYSVKLIDFAHATWTKGQGPDENVLLGVNSLIDIFKKLSE